MIDRIVRQSKSGEARSSVRSDCLVPSCCRQVGRRRGLELVEPGIVGIAVTRFHRVECGAQVQGSAGES